VTTVPTQKNVLVQSCIITFNNVACENKIHITVPEALSENIKRTFGQKTANSRKHCDLKTPKSLSFPKFPKWLTKTE
jgi:hypothetical protein